VKAFGPGHQKPERSELISAEQTPLEKALAQERMPARSREQTANCAAKADRITVKMAAPSPHWASPRSWPILRAFGAFFTPAFILAFRPAPARGVNDPCQTPVFTYLCG
jgi:hypothetical protein